MRRNKWLALALVMIMPAVIFTVSCAKEVAQTQPSETAAPETPARPVQPAQESQPAQTAPASGETDKTAAMGENVYFDFDSALLNDQARQRLMGQAEYLRSHSDLTVTIEGHCDERGTDAYNMALGQRRAESVKSFLVDLGIRTDRLDTISYGEERPAVSSHNESAWAQNRRAQFAID